MLPRGRLIAVVHTTTISKHPHSHSDNDEEYEV